MKKWSAVVCLIFSRDYRGPAWATITAGFPRKLDEVAWALATLPALLRCALVFERVVGRRTAALLDALRVERVRVALLVPELLRAAGL